MLSVVISSHVGSPGLGGSIGWWGRGGEGAGALVDATFGSSEGGLGITLALQRDLASSAAGK